MHTVFTVPELVELIVGAAVTRFSSTEEPVLALTALAKKDLCSLALTAKLFREATLNEIWHTQTSLIPILGIMNVLEEVKDQWRVYQVARPLTPSNAEVMSKYASRIRELLLPDTDRLRVPVTRHIFNGSIALFPQLCRLWCYTENLRILDFMVKATRDVSLDVVLHISETPTISMTTLKLLAGAEWMCKDIRLSQSRIFQAEDQALIDKLLRTNSRHCHSLHLTMDIDEDWDLLHITEQLPMLESLRLWRLSALPDQLTSITLPLLTSLEINMPTVPSFIDLVQHMSLPCLESLLVAFASARPLGHDQAVELFVSIANLCIVGKLHTLVVALDVERNHVATGNNYIGPEAFRPLLSFDMQVLQIDVLWSWDIGDELIRDMAQAWPNIIKLSLDVGGRWTEAITFGSLDVLARHCRQLKYLGLTLDSTVPPIPGRASRQTALGTFCPGTSSPRSNASDIVHFLTCTFPRLGNIEPYRLDYYAEPDEDDDTYVRFWKMVDQTMSLERAFCPWRYTYL